MNKRAIHRTASVALGLGAALLGSNASAQLWNPLDTKAKPNMLIAFDTSITMGITSDCASCHEQGGPGPFRLEDAKNDILAAMPLFQDLFIFGGYRYNGCDYAKVGARCYPNIADPDTSFNCVNNMISSAAVCVSPSGLRGAEQYLPGGNITTCITPACASDQLVVQALMNPGVLPGWTPPPLPVASSTTCFKELSPFVSVDTSATFLANYPSVDWPRWIGTDMDSSEVKAKICDPLIEAIEETWETIGQCLNDPEGYWPGIEAWLANAANCDPGTIRNNVCVTATSPLVPTCVCNSALPGCTGGTANSDCGEPLSFKARQQVAVCESYNPSTFQAAFKAQVDNRVNPGGCRENVALFFTDGFYGDSAMVQVEALKADLDGPYTPTFDNTLRNRFVFHVSNYGGDAANVMQSYLTNGLVTNRYSATDQAQMLESFSVMVNRVFRGVYSGSTPTFDRYGTRVAYHIFTVPAGSNAYGERYLGRPSRIAWHEVDPDTGAITPTPIFETDWASKAGPPLIGNFGFLDTIKLGPGGQFRTNVDRIQNVPANSTDRTGDGTADTHPALTYGYMLGGTNTQPVIVEAPREIPAGANGAAFSSWMLQPAVRNRPRVVYVLSNGYLHAFQAGSRVDNPGIFAGKTKLDFTYVEDGNSGKELWRYGPPKAGWLLTMKGGLTNYNKNDLIQQPILSGQIVVRDMKVGNTNTAADYQTLLAFSQGKAGRGYAILDVTDPMAGAGPGVLLTWAIPDVEGAASNEPMLYQLPNGIVGQTKVSLIVTSGYIGSGTAPRQLYRVDLGGASASIGLPGAGTEHYPTEPVCLDATGRGYITHCYVLSSLGRVVRVTLDKNSGNFVSAEDITPPGPSPMSPIGGSRVYFTRPVVYFGNDNAVNIAFGSGDIDNLVSAGVDTNAFFKVKDESFTQAVPPAKATGDKVCVPDSSSIDDGVFMLAAGERVVSPPIVSKGVVAFTTYTPGGSSCDAGSAKLYAFNFESCRDAFTGAERPTGVPIGTGIPTSPALLRPAEKVISMTSSSPGAATVSAAKAQTKGGQLMPLKRLFWRSLINSR